MATLQVYKASAGSGKTYHLTREYIKLLFANPYGYKNILAVTFTNKACAEMKERIVEQLYLMAKGESTGYSKSLKDDFSLTDLQVQEKAKLCLNLILNDFSKFSIETIDRFFQKIIMAFIREIGLQTGFYIELDTDNVLSEVVENLLFDIEKDPQLKNWLIDYAENKIEEGKSWNFKSELITLGKEIFKESFKISKKDIIEKAQQKDFLKTYISELIAYKKAFENQLSKTGTEALAIMQKHGLQPEDFSNGTRGVGGFLKKMSEHIVPEKINGYAEKCLIDTSKWSTAKSSKKAEIENAVNDGLQSILENIKGIYDSGMESYNSIALVLTYLPSLGIVTDITKRIREYTENNNAFLISDAAEFLYLITGNNDAPFIYEKVGTYYNHFMIDEFQDTSRLQWHNFKPLLHNNLANGNNALVVGDVKQSIYRWRNSDWKILAEEINVDLSPFDIETQSLSSNWRSAPEIIRFNNILFRESVNNLQNIYNSQIPEANNRILNVFEGLEQEIPEESRERIGRVDIRFFEKDSFNDDAKQYTIDRINEIKDHGQPLKDIAILVRNKSDGKEIADLLVEYNSKQTGADTKIEFISNDSLFLQSNQAIRIILYCLKYIMNPENHINGFNLVAEYHVFKSASTSSNHFPFIEYESRFNNIFPYLPEDFPNLLKKIKNLPVYDICELLTVYFGFEKQSHNHPFLQAFKDLTLDFSVNKTANLSSFIEWWDTIGIKKTIALNENQDAIKIITIHKSKGLQFKHVIIPFCNWNLDHNSLHTNILWCHPNSSPFNKLDILPIKYSGKMAKTIFANEYHEEKLNAFVDNLNLLYVAFTRAETSLNICCTDPDNEKTKIISGLIKDSVKNASEFETNWDENKKEFSYGALEETKQDKEPTEGQTLPYPSVPLFNRFEFTKQADEFFNYNTENTNKSSYGNLLHQVMQNIVTQNDIPKAFQSLLIEGKITNSEAEEFKELLTTSIAKKPYFDWFNGSYTVKNEQEILLKSGNILRPDRVMLDKTDVIVVDYKFGENIEKEHINQVRTYKNSLKQIHNSKNVCGFVWYFNLNKLIKVD